MGYRLNMLGIHVGWSRSGTCKRTSERLPEVQAPRMRRLSIIRLDSMTCADFDDELVADPVAGGSARMHWRTIPRSRHHADRR